MNIEIWTIGKKNDAFVETGIQHYLKRLKAYCKVSYIILTPPRRSANLPPEQSKILEEQIVLSRLDAGKHYLILLDETGKQLRSSDWAAAIGQIRNESVKTLVLLIGGPWGVTEKIKAESKTIWGLAKLTFPHQLVRLIVAEQLYRAFSILENGNYHHE